MKGILLAGGTGSRLEPLTRWTNKHLLPVYNRPMVLYSVDMLSRAGVKDILVVTGPAYAADFIRILGSGSEYGVRFSYRIQEEPKGIAHGIGLGRDFVGDDSVMVVLADNIFQMTGEGLTKGFNAGASIFLARSEHPEHYGVVSRTKDGRVVRIQEKPKKPASEWVQTGLYVYDNTVFEKIDSLSPSGRGELEVSELNELYMLEGTLRAQEVEGYWVDAGTHERLLEASLLVAGDKDIARTAVHPGQARVAVGLVTYNSAKYIQACLDRILAQTHTDIDIFVYDNGSEDETLQKVKQYGDKVTLIEGKENLGFGRAHNALIDASSAPYYLCLNVDMLLEPDFVAQLVRVATQNPDAGAFGGKLKQWNFEAYNTGQGDGKTNFFDTTGLVMPRHHRCIDRGQGEIDRGQYENQEKVWGISGAAVLLRRSALEDVAHKNAQGNEYFDARFFMYKEDVDLAYRLAWAGWDAWYVPTAVGFHDRTTHNAKGKILAMAGNRLFHRSKKANKQSYLNHQLMLTKNMTGHYPWRLRAAVVWYGLKVFCYLLLFETEVLFTWFTWKKWRKEMRQKSRRMPRRRSARAMEALLGE